MTKTRFFEEQISTFIKKLYYYILRVFGLTLKWFRKIFGSTLSVCMSVCLYPINVKSAEPIRPNFCVGLYMTPRKVYENLKNMPSTKFDFY